jgi:hypothetical protein
MLPRPLPALQTADKLSVEVISPPDDGDVVMAAVAAAVVPGGAAQQSSRLELPARRSVKVQAAQIDGQLYTYLQFPSETTTRSGYQVERRNIAVLASRKGRLYVCAASARSDQFSKQKRELLLRLVDSFRLV